MRHRSIVVLAAALAAAGCSPYVYKNEVTAVASGITSLQSAMTAAQTGVVTDVTALQIEGWSAQASRIDLTETCNDPSLQTKLASPCAITGPGAKPVPLGDVAGSGVIAEDAPAVTTAIADLSGVLGAYARALQAVSNAQDRTDLDTANGKLGTALSGFAKAFPGKSASSSATLALDTTSLLGQLIGAGMDRDRLTALTSAVARVDPDMDTIGGMVGDQLRYLASRRARTLNALVYQEWTLYRALPAGTAAAQREADLQRLATNVAALNKAVTVDGPGIGRALAKAHHDLNTALQANTGQNQALVTALEAFATSAEKLRGDIAPAPVPTATKKTS